MKKIFAKVGTLPLDIVVHVKGRLIPGKFVVVRRLNERKTIHCVVVEKVESPSGSTCHWVLSRM